MEKSVMEKTFNILELASELALKRVEQELIGEPIFEEQENGDTIYTEEAQDLFNGFYDEYFDILIDLD